MKYVEFKKYILHVKLTVYFTVSFTCNIYFLNSTYFILISSRVTTFRVSFAVEYILFCTVGTVLTVKLEVYLFSPSFKLLVHRV